jgi:methylated-DNA-[protein]-cysteine S-methyltransferase
MTMWTEIESPAGPVRIIADRGAITAVEFSATTAEGAPPRSSRAQGVQRAAGRPVGERNDDDPLLKEAARQLRGYFDGTLQEFDLPLRPDGTEFQQRVWSQLREIPYGKTMSYGEIAASLGLHRGASRAVGAANGRNPIGIVIPCHRVVGTNGSLSGYAGGVERKHLLLELEQGTLF